MHEILIPGKSAALVAAIRDNTFAYLVRRAKLRQAEVRIDDDFIWTFENPARPMCLLRRRLPPGEPEKEIERLLQGLERAGGPRAGIDVVEPAPLIERLSAFGLEPTEVEYGMAVPLAQFDRTLLERDRLQIKKVGDKNALAQCAEVVALGRGRQAADFFRVVHGELEEGEEQSKFYLASGKDGPVAFAGQFFAAGISAVWWVTTIPAMRRRGVGTAVTAAALLDAKEMGYQVASLLAVPGVQRMYQRLGFTECCRVAFFEWRAGSVPQREAAQPL